MEQNGAGMFGEVVGGTGCKRWPGNDIRMGGYAGLGGCMENTVAIVACDKLIRHFLGSSEEQGIRSQSAGDCASGDVCPSRPFEKLMPS